MTAQGLPLIVQVPITRNEWDHLQAVAHGARMPDGVTFLRRVIELAVQGLARPGSYEARWVSATLQAEYAYPVEPVPERPYTRRPIQAVRDQPLPLLVQPNPHVLSAPLCAEDRALLELLEDRGPTMFGSVPKHLFARVPHCCKASLVIRRGMHLVLSGHGRHRLEAR